jgi:hypothetical protein
MQLFRSLIMACDTTDGQRGGDEGAQHRVLLQRTDAVITILVHRH